jgi:hypothetical protein
MTGRKNILKVLGRADSVDIDEGLLAFSRYQEMMARLASYYGYPLAAVTAAFCALSPNNDYLKNLRSTVTLLKGHREGIPVERLTVSTYNACKFRAWKAINGTDFLSFTKGKKTRAFYQNILDPFDPHPVTIDGHMVSAWTGKRMTMLQVATRGFNYELIADDFRAVAYRERLLPNQLQAIIWFTWKRINQVLFDGQYCLFDFDLNNQWRLYREPKSIKPFPVKDADAEQHHSGRNRAEVRTSSRHSPKPKAREAGRPLVLPLQYVQGL